MRGRLGSLRECSYDVLAQNPEDLRHAHQHRSASTMDQREDVVRVEAPREDYKAAHHGRDARRHRLPEHVTQRKQIQEANWMKGTRVILVFMHFALDRN